MRTFFGGDVYSSVDPFATALSCSDGVISFVGSDEAAQALDPQAEDLHGDFLTPGFVATGFNLDQRHLTVTSLLSAGFTSAQVIGSTQTVATFAAEAPAGFTIDAWLSDTSAAGGPASHTNPAPQAHSATNADSAAPANNSYRVRGRMMTAAALLADPGLAAGQDALFIELQQPGELTALLARVLTDPAVTARRGHRFLVSVSLDHEEATALAASGIPASLDPVTHPNPVAALLSAGAQLSFVPDPTNPWQTVRAAVFGAAEGISARAAFNACTRFAHRAIGAYEAGVLAPGAPADFVRWQVNELVIQVADERLAAWSTDPRSGTPGLPDVSPEATLPTPSHSYVSGY